MPNAGHHAATDLGTRTCLAARDSRIGAPVMIFSPEGLPRLRGLERELAQVQDETAELGREIESLRGRVQRLRDDPTAVERIARDNLGMLRQTEVVFQFPAAR